MPRTKWFGACAYESRPGSFFQQKPENQLVFGASNKELGLVQVRSWLPPLVSRDFAIPLNTTSEALSQTFFHPDFTVGSGVSPDHASNLTACQTLAGFTAGRELSERFRSSHPAPKVNIFNFSVLNISQK
jgi:hypothetical protein